MPRYELAGISVHFPYAAYEAQLKYMETVIQALQRGENALLESPTGTGKTLCLLCATLAWRSAVIANQQVKDLNSSGYEQPPKNPFPTATTTSLTSHSSHHLIDIDQQSNQTSSSNGPLIIYASRTHSQLSQVVGELRRTIYRPRMAVVGSREQLCTNTKVRDLRTKNAALTAVCQQLVRKNACEQHGRVGEAQMRMEYLRGFGGNGEAALMDMEDLVKLAKSHQSCAYYLAKNELSNADIVFLPYNYLIDRKSKGTLAGLSFESAIIIFDEAHNLEGSCGDASSAEFTGEQVERALDEVRKCQLNVETGLFTAGGIDLTMLSDNQTILNRLKHTLATLPLDLEGKLERKGEFIIDFFAAAGMREDEMSFRVNQLESIAKAYVEGEYLQRSRSIHSNLQSLSSALRTIFQISEDTSKQGTAEEHHNNFKNIAKIDQRYFRVFVETINKDEHEKIKGSTTISNSSENAKDRKLNYWCFNAGIIMRELVKRGVHSILLTSGTLSPLSSFTAELQIPFPHQLENSHVIGSSQIFCSVIKTGPSNQISLNSSYQQRDSRLYQRELGQAILQTCTIVPEGVLVFFPSYSVMGQCINCWKMKLPTDANKSVTIWDQISSLKYPVIEPKTTKGAGVGEEQLSVVMQKYYTNITQGKGAIFFAVCRGKVSEGLDFADGKGRAVIITGIPYPPLKDPKVILKRQYLDDWHRAAGASGESVVNSKNSKSHNKSNVSLSGEEWYKQQALRAVNQAIGRVIRHVNDYGAILLFDERFSQDRTINQLSKWLQPHVKVMDSFVGMQTLLTDFFIKHENNKLSKGVNTNILTSEDHAVTTTLPSSICSSTDRAREMAERVRSRFAHVAAVASLATSSLTHDQLPSTIAPSTTNTSPFSIVQRNNDESDNNIRHPFNSNNSDSKRAFLKAFAPTINKSSDRRPELRDQAQDYLSTVKSVLSRNNFKEFNSMLKQYRARQVDINQLISSVLNIFQRTDNSNGWELRVGFRDFISVKHRDLYDAEVARREEEIKQCHGTKSEELPVTTIDPEVHVSPTSNYISNTKTTPSSPCIVCREPITNAYRAKCGHEACFGCWSTWLNVKLECPVCRNRTRIPQLRKSSLM